MSRIITGRLAIIYRPVSDMDILCKNALTGITALINTQQKFDAIVPGIRAEDVDFFLLGLLAGSQSIKLEIDGLTKCHVSGKWAVEGWALSNTLKV
jgi:hypothetical protein